MAQKNTSVSLGVHFDNIIQSSIESGRYASASEVIREGLRLVEEREKKIIALRQAIEAGEASGYVTDFNPTQFLDGLHDKHLK